jgi:hypothetical protein
MASFDWADFEPIVPPSGQRETDAVLEEIGDTPLWARDAQQEHVFASHHRRIQRRQKPQLARNWITHQGDGVQDYDFSLRSSLDYVVGRLRKKASDANDVIRDFNKELRSATSSGVEAQRWIRQQRALRLRRANSGRSSSVMFEMFAVKTELKESQRKRLAAKKAIAVNLTAISQGEARCKWLSNCVYNEWSDTTDYDDSADESDGGQCGQLGIH